MLTNAQKQARWRLAHPDQVQTYRERQNEKRKIERVAAAARLESMTPKERAEHEAKRHALMLELRAKQPKSKRVPAMSEWAITHRARMANDPAYVAKYRAKMRRDADVRQKARLAAKAKCRNTLTRLFGGEGRNFDSVGLMELIGLAIRKRAA